MAQRRQHALRQGLVIGWGSSARCIRIVDRDRAILKQPRPAPLGRPALKSSGSAPRTRAVLGSLHPLQIAPTNVMAAPACFRAAPSGKLTTSGLAARSTPPSSISSRVAVVRSSNGAGPVAAVGATEVRRPTRRRICAGVPDWICTLVPPALCTECHYACVAEVAGRMLQMYA